MSQDTAAAPVAGGMIISAVSWHRSPSPDALPRPYPPRPSPSTPRPSPVTAGRDHAPRGPRAAGHTLPDMPASYVFPQPPTAPRPARRPRPAPFLPSPRTARPRPSPGRCNGSVTLMPARAAPMQLPIM